MKSLASQAVTGQDSLIIMHGCNVKNARGLHIVSAIGGLTSDYLVCCWYCTVSDYSFNLLHSAFWCACKYASVLFEQSLLWLLTCHYCFIGEFCVSYVYTV